MRNHTKFTPAQKLRALDEWRAIGYTNATIGVICKKHKCSRAILYMWKAKYKGRIENLTNIKPVPHSPHPKQMSEVERGTIRDILIDNPTASLMCIFGLFRSRGYNRNPSTIYKYIKNHCKHALVKSHVQCIAPKHYETPLMVGVKAQMDVKEVPKFCYAHLYADKHGNDIPKWYAYTYIDEASRKMY